MRGLAKHVLSIILLLFLCAPIQVLANKRLVEPEPLREPLARKIIALYSSEYDEKSHMSALHLMAEMPLNHLGFILEYYDIEEGLPDLSARPDVRGILTWFPSGMGTKNPKEFISWALKALSLGKKYVVLEEPGFLIDKNGKETDAKLVSSFFNALGLKDQQNWVSITYDVGFVVKDANMVEYERKLSAFKHGYRQLSQADSRLRPLLVARQGGDPDSDAVLMAVGPKGGYVASGYCVLWDWEVADEELRQWIINPFEFFRAAFDSDHLPKPDTTTLDGRRIYFSHIDGDGWNNISKVEKYNGKKVYAAQVVLEEAIAPFPDLPISVSAIAADLDLNWVGKKASRDLAVRIFALPQVEIGSHTYSHPFQWEFFEDGNAEKELPFLRSYPHKTWKDSLAKELNPFSFLKRKSKLREKGLGKGYLIPRAFAVKPFDIDLEIEGSVRTINELAPEGKKVEVLMWSGNTLPFEEALKKARIAGLKNINGGDARYDREFPSNAWVSPIGRQVGSETQIFASNSNENTYTDLWRRRFHGFQYLRRTFRNTNIPLRLKPINVYYHMYSGEKEASLNALLLNLEYARKQKIIPITTSHFSGIGEGFFSSKVWAIGKDTWLIGSRGQLQTFRFDFATLKAVDFQKSRGVIGQRHFQGSLYVFLDPKIKTPLIALRDHLEFFKDPSATRPYLIESRWPITHLEVNDGRVEFKVIEGFGPSEMTWKVQTNTNYQVKFVHGVKVVFEQIFRSDNLGRLSFSADLDVNEGLIVQIIRKIDFQG